jgi:hypothetical protein
MKRTVSVVLLLFSGVVTAGAQTGPAPGAAAGQAPAATVATEPERPQLKTEGAPVPPTADAQAPTPEPPPEKVEDAKLVPVPGSKALGMSILGNQEAPTSLVIVPWKSSELGDSMGVSTLLDDSRQPVDKDVFMRSLRYYEIRSATKP